MDQTFFYVVGISLVALAFIVSMIGLRVDGFPSNGVLRVGILFVALVVGLTAAAAVSSSGKEQEQRGAEANREAAATEATQAATNEAIGGGGSASGTQEEPAQPTTGPSGGNTPAGGADGAAVFADNGCGGCHTLAAASSQGEIGPNLDEALVDKDPAFIETSIVDPNAVVQPGYPADTMPPNFGTVIAPDDLKALVSYLSQSTSGK